MNYHYRKTWTQRESRANAEAMPETHLYSFQCAVCGIRAVWGEISRAIAEDTATAQCWHKHGDNWYCPTCEAPHE